MMVRRRIATVTSGCAWALLATVACRESAWAHAFLDHADPRVGSTVSSPAALTLSFTEPVEPDFSRVEVHDVAGKRVDTGTAAHPTPQEIRVPFPPLPPGTYSVHWAVTSVDTHQTEGTFKFSVSSP